MKRNITNALAVISTIGILCWIISDYYGGMIIHLVSYGIIIAPVLLLYITSVIETIVSLANKGFRHNRLKVKCHSILLVCIIIFNLVDSEIFKSKKVLTAILKDDQFNYTLTLREDGSCENIANGIFGYKEIFKGRYKMKQDTIIFLVKYYENDFLPDTIFFDKTAKAIFLNRDAKGAFLKKKKFLNHFEVQ